MGCAVGAFSAAGISGNLAGRLHVGCAGRGGLARSASLHGSLSRRQDGWRRDGPLNPAAAILGESCRRQLNTAFLFLARRRLRTLGAGAEIADGGRPSRGVAGCAAGYSCRFVCVRYSRPLSVSRNSWMPILGGAWRGL